MSSPRGVNEQQYILREVNEKQYSGTSTSTDPKELPRKLVNCLTRTWMREEWEVAHCKLRNLPKITRSCMKADMEAAQITHTTTLPASELVESTSSSPVSGKLRER